MGSVKAWCVRDPKGLLLRGTLRPLKSDAWHTFMCRVKMPKECARERSEGWNLWWARLTRLGYKAVRVTVEEDQ